MTTITLEERPTWEDVALSFVPPDKRDYRSKALVARLPLITILVGQAVLTWRLSDVVNDDEALYINAGHDLLRHVVHGTPVAVYGSYFSGAPAGYPIPAAVLDGIGGLDLVRLFSLACLLFCTWCVHNVANHVFGRRTGLMAALAFAVSGSVLFVGKLATYDAPCIALIAAALTVGLTKVSVTSGAAVGALLALAAATKYAGAAFIPAVLGLCLIPLSITSPRSLLRPVARAGVAAVTAAGLLLGAYRLWGSSIKQGLSFTTTNRRALDYQPTTLLVRSVVFDIGLLLALALAGLVILALRRSYAQFVIGCVCVLAGLLLPVSQIRIHEFTSLDKHTAFSALFLALPAAVALDLGLTKRVGVKVAIAGVVWLLLIDGLWRSDTQFSWPESMLSTLHAVEKHPVRGLYVSTDGDSEKYYTPSDSPITWEPSAFAYSLLGQGPQAVATVIRSNKYAGFVYRSSGFSGESTATERTMTRVLGDDPAYRLVARIRVDPYHDGHWYVWQKVWPRPRVTVVDAAARLSPGTATGVPVLGGRP